MTTLLWVLGQVIETFAGVWNEACRDAEQIGHRGADRACDFIEKPPKIFRRR